MSRQDPNGHLTIAVFEQFEKRFEERIDDVETKIGKLEQSFENHRSENRTSCKEIREKCVSTLEKKIDCQVVKTNNKLKYLMWAVIIVTMGFILTHPQSIQVMAGFVKAPIPIEQVLK
jgi:hypothetical protein